MTRLVINGLTRTRARAIERELNLCQGHDWPTIRSSSMTPTRSGSSTPRWFRAEMFPSVLSFASSTRWSRALGRCSRMFQTAGRARYPRRIRTEHEGERLAFLQPGVGAPLAAAFLEQGDSARVPALRSMWWGRRSIACARPGPRRGSRRSLPRRGNLVSLPAAVTRDRGGSSSCAHSDEPAG